MAAIFPAMCKTLVVVSLVALIFFAGAEAAPLDSSAPAPLDSNTPPFESDYYICQSLKSNLVKPNCRDWCRHMGKPDGGYITNGSCCCYH